MWQYQYTDELYHHGVPGQRWGFRRYQNPDGTLTPAGRRRAGKLAKQYAKVTGKKLIVKKKSVQGNELQRPKTLSEMSNQEIQAKIDRMRLEDTYSSIVASRVPKPKVSRGRKFVNSVNENIIAPALVDAGKILLGNLIKKKGNDIIYGNGKKAKNNIQNNNAKKKTEDILKNDLGTITITINNKKKK